jgi:hypothetical protein
MPTFSGNGAGDEIVVGSQFDKAWLHASGTFGGGTVSWEFKGDDGSFHPFESSTDMTANSDVEVPVGSGALIVRPTLAGATAPSIYYHAK